MRERCKISATASSTLNGPRQRLPTAKDRAAETAARLDPESRSYKTNLAYVLLNNRRGEEAREVAEDLKEVARALKAPLSSLGILSDYAARKIHTAIGPGGLAAVAPALAAEAETVTRYTRVTGSAVETLLRRHGKGVIEKEYHQERLADVAVSLYACLAVLSRATAAVRSRGPEGAADEVRVAKVFVERAKHRMVGLLKEMDRNIDAERTAISETAYASLGYAFPYWR